MTTTNALQTKVRDRINSNRLSWGILAVVLAIFLPFMALMWPAQGNIPSGAFVKADSFHSGIAQSVDSSACDTIYDNEMPCVALSATLDTGEDISVATTKGDSYSGVAAGDRIVVAKVISNGSDFYTFHSIERTSNLVWLAILAAIFVVLVTGRKGLIAILGMTVSYVLFWFFLLPGITQGGNPVNYAVVTCAVVLVMVLYGTHGVNLKTTSALIGTVSGLLVSAVLGFISSALLNMSGATRATQGILLQGESIDLKTLAMAGLMIASLGILNDITVAQASTVWSLTRNQVGSRAEVVRQAISIGRDHASSAIYTIAFSLVGASLGAMVLAGGQGMTLWAWVQDEAVTETLVQVLVGAIGLVVAMPLTTIVASFLQPLDLDDDDQPEKEKLACH